MSVISYTSAAPFIGSYNSNDNTQHFASTSNYGSQHTQQSHSQQTYQNYPTNQQAFHQHQHYEQQLPAYKDMASTQRPQHAQIYQQQQQSHSTANVVDTTFITHNSVTSGNSEPHQTNVYSGFRSPIPSTPPPPEPVSSELIAFHEKSTDDRETSAGNPFDFVAVPQLVSDSDSASSSLPSRPMTSSPSPDPVWQENNGYRENVGSADNRALVPFFEPQQAESINDPALDEIIAAQKRALDRASKRKAAKEERKLGGSASVGGSSNERNQIYGTHALTTSKVKKHAGGSRSVGSTSIGKTQVYGTHALATNNNKNNSVGSRSVVLAKNNTIQQRKDQRLKVASKTGVHPHKNEMKKDRKAKTVGGAISGAVLGGLILGPVGVVLGGVAGGAGARKVAKAGEKRAQRRFEQRSVQQAALKSGATRGAAFA